MERRADADTMTDAGWSASMLCVSSGNSEALQVLMDGRADINARGDGERGRTCGRLGGLLRARSLGG